MQTIVIVGGGAGGMELATRLGDSIGSSTAARIVLVDRWPAHFWKPLLHTVASGKHDPAALEVDYAAQASEHGFEFARGEVRAVDRHARFIELAPLCADDGAVLMPARRIGYDKLVLALGAVTNLYDVPGAAEHVLTLDNVSQAAAFQQRFVDSCIRASAKAGADGIDIVIVGGGATGVELACELSHSASTLARYHVHALDPVRKVRICVLERGSLLLPHLHRRQSKRAARHLRKLGIRVVTDASVARVDAHAVHDSEGALYPSSMTLWAAGIKAPALCASLGLTANRLGQIAVDQSLQALDDDFIYAIGDCAAFVCPVQGALPPRAQAAHQQAMFLADVLARPQRAKPACFAYHDYGSMVSLGPQAALGVLNGALGAGKLQVGGALARFLYAMMYRKHMLALHGFARMAAHALAEWIKDKVSPSVKLH
jgi:NADH dehydrogenase